MITDAKQKYPETFQKVPTRQYEPIKPSEGRGKGKGKGGPSKKPQKDQRTPSHFTVTLECKYCGRKGHYEDECWTKEKDERKRQQSSGKSGRPSGDHPGRTPRRTPSKPPTNSQNPAQNSRCLKKPKEIKNERRMPSKCSTDPKKPIPSLQASTENEWSHFWIPAQRFPQFPRAWTNSLKTTEDEQSP